MVKREIIKMKAKILLAMNDNGEIASNISLANNLTIGELSTITLTLEMMRDKLKTQFEKNTKMLEKR
jgi:hypothetical protein